MTACEKRQLNHTTIVTHHCELWAHNLSKNVQTSIQPKPCERRALSCRVSTCISLCLSVSVAKSSGVRLCYGPGVWFVFETPQIENLTLPSQARYERNCDAEKNWTPKPLFRRDQKMRTSGCAVVLGACVVRMWGVNLPSRGPSFLASLDPFFDVATAHCSTHKKLRTLMWVAGRFATASTPRPCWRVCFIFFSPLPRKRMYVFLLWFLARFSLLRETVH